MLSGFLSIALSFSSTITLRSSLEALVGSSNACANCCNWYSFNLLELKGNTTFLGCPLICLLMFVLKYFLNKVLRTKPLQLLILANSLRLRLLSKPRLSHSKYPDLGRTSSCNTSTQQQLLFNFIISKNSTTHYNFKLYIVQYNDQYT